MNIKNKNIRTWEKTLDNPLNIASSIYIFIMKKKLQKYLAYNKVSDKVSNRGGLGSATYQFSLRLASYGS